TGEESIGSCESTRSLSSNAIVPPSQNAAKESNKVSASALHLGCQRGLARSSARHRPGLSRENDGASTPPPRGNPRPSAISIADPTNRIGLLMRRITTGAATADQSARPSASTYAPFVSIDASAYASNVSMPSASANASVTCQAVFQTENRRRTVV